MPQKFILKLQPLRKKQSPPPQDTESTDTTAPSTSTSHHCDITSINHRSPPVLYPKDLENLLLPNQSLLKEIHQKDTSRQLPSSGVNLLPPPPEVSSKPIVHTSTIEGIKKSKNIIDLLEVPNANFLGRHVLENWATIFTIKCETCFLYVQNAVTAGKNEGGWLFFCQWPYTWWECLYDVQIWKCLS